MELVIFLALWYMTPVIRLDRIRRSFHRAAEFRRGARKGGVARHEEKAQACSRRMGSQAGWTTNLFNSTALDDMDDMEWSFSVVHANVVNAYCLPGGIVRVTNALLSKLDLTQGELAALLGHEIGHIVHRHAQRRIIQQHLHLTCDTSLAI